MNAQSRRRTVVQVDLRLRNRRFLLSEMGRQCLPQFRCHGFDVLASTERVLFEIRAGARVVADIEAANADGVGPAGIGIRNGVVGEDAVLSAIFNSKPARFGPFPAEADLFFAEHAVRLRSPRRRAEKDIRRFGGDGGECIHQNATLVAILCKIRDIQFRNCNVPEYRWSGPNGNCHPE